MGLDNLWAPALRGVIEQNIAAIARGQVRFVNGLRLLDPGGVHISRH